MDLAPGCAGLSKNTMLPESYKNWAPGIGGNIDNANFRYTAAVEDISKKLYR